MDSGKLTKTQTGGGTPFSGEATAPGYEQEAGAPSTVTRPFLQRTRHLVRGYHAQTKEVGPGESLSLTLRIESKAKRPLEGSYLYNINSQQVPMIPANVEIPQVSSSGTVHFKSVPLWRYWLPLMVCGLVVIVTLITLSIIFIQG